MLTERNSSITIIKLNNKEKKKLRGDEFKSLAAKFNAFQRVMFLNDEIEWSIFKLENESFFQKNKILIEKPLKELVREKILRPKSLDI